MNELSDSDRRALMVVATIFRNASVSAETASKGLRYFGAAADRASETARKIRWPGNSKGGANG